jgi:hypothetical protein
MSILMNAIEAISRWSSKEKIIKLRTELVSDGETGEDFVRMRSQTMALELPKKFSRKSSTPSLLPKMLVRGRGLGLTVSYQTIVSQHQGNLQLSLPTRSRCRVYYRNSSPTTQTLSPSKGEIGDRELGTGNWEDTTMKLAMEIRKTPLGKIDNCTKTD